MPKSRSLDIDTESDFLKAQKNLNSKKNYQIYNRPLLK